MEEKPVQGGQRHAKVSLWLGILGFITSPVFILMLPQIPPRFGGEWLYIFMDWWAFGSGLYILMPFNLIVGAAAVMEGRAGIKEGQGNGAAAWTGILLGGITFLCGVLVGIIAILFGNHLYFFG